MQTNSALGIWGAKIGTWRAVWWLTRILTTHWRSTKFVEEIVVCLVQVLELHGRIQDQVIEWPRAEFARLPSILRIAEPFGTGTPRRLSARRAASWANKREGL